MRYQLKEAPLVDMVDTEKLRAAFEDRYVGCKMYVNEHLPEAAAYSSLNKTFFEVKTTNNTYMHTHIQNYINRYTCQHFSTLPLRVLWMSNPLLNFLQLVSPTFSLIIKKKSRKASTGRANKTLCMSFGFPKN